MTIVILVNFKLFKIVRYPVKRSHSQHPQNPIAFFLKSNSNRPSPPTKPDHLFPTQNSDRLFMLVILD
ncbi:MAG: hypothetical protein NTU99_05080 [Pseudanabaena sp. LacPavin_0818_WC45_MAG_42_6]|nr:hypothetical protein [Pseudanabaena sp. LacPavin_0818_WC45_MAG_42_6]